LSEWIVFLATLEPLKQYNHPNWQYWQVNVALAGPENEDNPEKSFKSTMTSLKCP
jgi:hypothetical protein